jgi:hypothetical protein
LLVRLDQCVEVDVEQLVAVEREDRTVVATARRGEAQPAAPPERLVLTDGIDLGADAPECVHERFFLAGTAGDDHARDAGPDEARDRVFGEREAPDRDERLRKPLSGFAEPFGLAAREEQRLHQRWNSGARNSGSAGEACRGRPIPS